MIAEFSMTQILNKISLLKKKVEANYETYLNPDSSQAQRSRLLINLYFPKRNVTFKGLDVSKVSRDIQSTYDELVNYVELLQKFSAVKEQVNAISTIEIPNLSLSGNDTMKVTIAQALSLKSDRFYKYYQGLLNKLISDKESAYLALEDYETSVMSKDRIDTYVVTKLNNLNISIENANKMENNRTTYEEFSNEYIEANKLNILDPIDIDEKIKLISKKIDDFYSTIDYKLSEFNATTKVWIDLDSKDLSWGFVEK